MTACSLLVLIIGSMWQEKAKQSADDHAELSRTVTAVADVKKDVAEVKNAVDSIATEQREFRGASNARWGALLEALPDVEKKLRRTTPVFEPEWHYRTDTQR